MDIFTQGLLGGALAQSCADKELRAATTVGFVAGLLPDADTLIRSTSDPLLFLQFHRHFTHSLVFVPIGAAIAAVLLWPLFRRRLRVVELYGFALLGYALAGLLDACTSYGTHLLWPFTDQPVAWNIISIVDPLFSLVLLVGVVVGYWLRRSRPVRLALLVAGCYLAFAAWQHERVEDAARALAASRGHAPGQLMVKPTIGNIILWRSLYVHERILYADGIRQGLTGAPIVYQGVSRPLLTLDSLSGSEKGAFRPRDLYRFAQFSDQLLVRHPHRSLFIGDARFAMLPTSLRPLWGIEPGVDASAGAVFVADRELGPDERARFVRMLTGRL